MHERDVDPERAGRRRVGGGGAQRRPEAGAGEHQLRSGDHGDGQDERHDVDRLDGQAEDGDPAAAPGGVERQRGRTEAVGEQPLAEEQQTERRDERCLERVPEQPLQEQPLGERGDEEHHRPDDDEGEQRVDRHHAGDDDRGVRTGEDDDAVGEVDHTHDAEHQ